jgi:hypothetical protein
MKTLKTLSAALLILLSFTAFAADETGNEKLNMNYALTTYIDAVTHGNIKGLADVLDKDVKFTSTRGEQIINHNKAEVLSLLKHSENTEQNCSTVYNIIESNQTLSVVKIVMKYPEFSKVTYLNIANTAKGWKITNVSSSYH